jgi:DNA invertase Pin-like site-specific DNA recombinase
MPAEITAQLLAKFAYVYVRQSTPYQVKHNLLSQQLQYDLVELAKAKGWPQEKIIIVDEDLGKSASGTAHREGLEKMLAHLCLGEVGALFCAEASRLARNGREWHQIIDFCSIVGAIIIDYEGAYDPRLPSDRLVLGVKGTVSQFEVDLFRKRAQDSIRKKAQSGELWTTVPAAFNLTEDHRCEIHPDLRIQQATQLVFQKFRELGSMRQVYFWCYRENIELPVRDAHLNNRIVWRVPKQDTIRTILINPLYAGAYIYPRTHTVTRIVEGRPVKIKGLATPPDQYQVLIRDLFPSYITWEEFQNNQKLIANNAAMKGNMAQGAVRKGEALLLGLVRCQRCSRRMHVRYHSKLASPTYTCRSAFMGGGVKPCPTFQARRLEQVIVQQALNVLQPHALEAAVALEEKMQQAAQQKSQALALALEQARYEADRIQRQLDAVEPEKTFVFRELTRRWQQALVNCEELEQRCQQAHAQQPSITAPEREQLFRLAEDLNQVWQHPNTTPQTKKRLLRTLIKEVLVQVRPDATLIATVHWQGGVHTEFFIQRVRRLRAAHKTIELELLNLIKILAKSANDVQIVRVLNRLGRKTEAGKTWTKYEVIHFRQAHNIPVFSQEEYEREGWLNLKMAAKELGINMMTVRSLIQKKIIKAEQVVPYAPWRIANAEINKPAIRRIINQIKHRQQIPSYQNPNQLTLE